MRWFLVVLAACGGPSLAPDAPPFDFPDAPQFFPDGQVCTTTCGGACVDLATDPLHCGSCINACPSSLPVCLHATCAAPLKTQWATHFGGADLGNAITGAAMDPSGNVYVTGAIAGSVDLGGGTMISAGATDLVVASFSSTGAFRWAKRFGGVDVDTGAGIAYVAPRVDVIANFSGTVDFGGTMLTSAGGTDIAVLELDDTMGDVLAARRYGTPNVDTGYAISGDGGSGYVIAGSFGAGNFDLGGMVLSGGGLATGFVAAFSFGATNWARAFGGTVAGETSSCRALAHDINNNTLVAGAFTGTIDFGFGPVVAAASDAFVVNLAQLGMPNWVHSFGGPDDDSANAIASDQLGNVVVGGSFHGSVNFGTGLIPSTGSLDGFLVGYSLSGAFRFARHLGATTSSSVTGLVALTNGDFVATGRLAGTADLGSGPLAPLGLDDVFVAELSGANAQFAKRYGGADLDIGAALGVDQSNFLVLGGRFRGTADLGNGAIAGGAKDNGFALVMSP